VGGQYNRVVYIKILFEGQANNWALFRYKNGNLNASKFFG